MRILLLSLTVLSLVALAGCNCSRSSDGKKSCCGSCAGKPAPAAAPAAKP